MSKASTIAGWVLYLALPTAFVLSMGSDLVHAARGWWLSHQELNQSLRK